MACVRAAFDAMAWQPGAHPLERKKVCEERPLALLELERDFADPQVCRRSHVIYVLRGLLELELDASVERFETGQCCWIDAGTAHRARNAGDHALLIFVASDLEKPR